MKRAQIEELYHRTVEILEQSGCNVHCRFDYSGRGMYGKLVPAIVTDTGAMSVGMAYMRAATEMELGEVDAARWAPHGSDSMGLEKVFYCGRAMPEADAA